MERRLAGIDGVRGLAVTAVVLYHVDRYTPLAPSVAFPPLAGLVTHLWIGVTVFFVLSGFLLYRPFAAAALEGRPPPSLRRYARRRFLRIVPAYWLALTVILLTLHPRLVEGPAWRWLVHYLFLQIYVGGSTETVIGPAWTLCIEVTFYAVLPLYAAVAHRVAGPSVRRHAALLAPLLALGLAYRAARLPLALPEFADLFAVGMLLAVALERLRLSGARPPGLERRLLLAAGLLAALALPVAHPDALIARGGSPLSALYDLLVAAATACALASFLVAERATRLERFLTLPLLAWLGTVSYGLYLWHEPLLTRLYWRVMLEPVHAGLLRTAQMHVLYAPALATMLALALGAAALSWRLVELRALRR